jgi:hypothetical protein
MTFGARALPIHGAHRAVAHVEYDDVSETSTSDRHRMLLDDFKAAMILFNGM